MRSRTAWNPRGTFPVHSLRVFGVLSYLRKTAALYYFPYENHEPATEAIMLDLWSRWAVALDLHLEHSRWRGGRGRSGAGG